MGGIEITKVWINEAEHIPNEADPPSASTLRSRFRILKMRIRLLVERFYGRPTE